MGIVMPICFCAIGCQQSTFNRLFGCVFLVWRHHLREVTNHWCALLDAFSAIFLSFGVPQYSNRLDYIKACDQQFTLTTKKSLHATFNMTTNKQQLVHTSGHQSLSTKPSPSHQHITAASTYVWTSVTKHQAQPHPPMMVLRFRAPQHPPTNAPRNMHIWCQLDHWLNYATNKKFAYTTQNKPRARGKSKRCRLIMHRRIGGHCKHRPDVGTRRRKIWSTTLKNKLRRRRNVVNEYQVSRKCTTRSMPGCTCVVVEIFTTVH